MPENFVDLLEVIIIQHTLNVLVHMVIYVYTKTDKRTQRTKCFFMEHHTKQSVHS